MIEVEKKFVLTPEIKQAICAVATFVSKKKFRDVYFDTADHYWLQKDWWLRKRVDQFEFKTKIKNTSGHLNTYREITDFKEIAEVLDLVWDGQTDPEQFLRSHGYQPFIDLTTTREKYKLEHLTIDFDIVDFGFTVFETEVMVDDPKNIPQAEEDMLACLKKYNISPVPVRFGKGLVYLEKFNPALYKQFLAWFPKTV